MRDAGSAKFERLKVGAVACVALVSVGLVVAALRAPVNPPVGLPPYSRPSDTSTAQPSTPPSTEPSTGPTGPPGPAQPSVLVIGDGWAVRGQDGAPTWARRLAKREGWVLSVDAVPGSGYLTSGPGRTTLDRRLDGAVSAAPDAVVVALGHDDASRFGNDELARAAAAAVARLTSDLPTARLFVLSPFSAGRSDGLAPLDRKIGAALRGLGATYVETTNAFYRHPELIGPDGETPTAKGLQFLAEYVQKQLDRLGVTPLEAP